MSVEKIPTAEEEVFDIKARFNCLKDAVKKFPDKLADLGKSIKEGINKLFEAMRTDKEAQTRMTQAYAAGPTDLTKEFAKYIPADLAKDLVNAMLVWGNPKEVDAIRKQSEDETRTVKIHHEITSEMQKQDTLEKKYNYLQQKKRQTEIGIATSYSLMQANPQYQNDLAYHIAYHKVLCDTENSLLTYNPDFKKPVRIQAERPPAQDVFHKSSAEVQQAINRTKNKILKENGKNIAHMSEVALFLKTGQISLNLLNVLHQSKNQDQEKQLLKRFTKLESRKDGKVSAKQIKNLEEDKWIEKAACIQLCSEAREQLPKDVNLEKIFGKAQGWEFYEQHSDQSNKYDNSFSSKMTIPNFLLSRAVDGGVMITAFNLIVAFRTGNWDNEYLLIGPAMAYGASQMVHRNTLDTLSNPQNKILNIAKRLGSSYSVGGKRISEALLDPQEVSLAKMIDWQEVREDKNLFKLKDYETTESKVGLTDTAREKDRKRAISTAEWQKNKLKDFPLVNDSYQSVFQERLGQMTSNHGQRYELLKFISQEKTIAGAGQIEELAYHAKKIAEFKQK